jgi:uncharacterized protein YkwD
MRPGATFRAALAMLAVAACLAATAGTAAAITGAALPTPVPAIPAAAPIPDEPYAAERDALFAGVDADRAAAGLVRYVRDPALERVAQDRAERLAASPVFGHLEAGPPILDSVEATGIVPYVAGEALGWTSRRDDPLGSIRRMWQQSPSHRAIVQSDMASYAGVGVVVRGDRTVVVLVTAETADRTPPVVTDLAVSRQGDAFIVRWTAQDPVLQAHTAGVRDAAIEYRVSGGPWHVLQRSNARGSARLARPAAGVTYEVRVRARDRAGNLSSWVQTAAIPAR